jgi:hypothetical protein
MWVGVEAAQVCLAEIPEDLDRRFLETYIEVRRSDEG